jgi:PAS domain-containing protein
MRKSGEHWRVTKQPSTLFKLQGSGKAPTDKVSQMQPRSLVLILARDLAEKLATAMFVVDHEGTLVFFNEMAEQILGRTFSDVGPLRLEDWTEAFSPVGPDGKRLSADELALVIAYRERRPSHHELKIKGLDNQERQLAVTALPLFARTNEFVGAAAVFWEVSPEDAGGGA